MQLAGCEASAKVRSPGFGRRAFRNPSNETPRHGSFPSSRREYFDGAIAKEA